MRVGRRLLLATSCVAVIGASLAGCSKPTVTPAPTTPVAYTAIGSGAANPGNTVTPVATSTGKVGRPITVGTLPSALALVPGGASLLVAVKAEDQIVEISTASGKVTKKAEVGLEPDAVAVTPDGSTALVANFGDNTVTEVQLPAMTVGHTIAVGGQPVAIAVTPDGTQALVANFQDGTLTPVALPTLSTRPPVPVGPEPVAVAIASSGTVALVAGFQTGSVTPVALPSLTPEEQIPVGANASGILIPVRSQTAWVSAGDGVTPVSFTSGQVGTPIPVAGPATCIAAGAAQTAWVCTSNSRLVEVDLAMGTVVRTVNLTGIPAAIAVTSLAAKS
jgi:DNA-binding beta-propeller fold protein YncE